MPVVDKALNLDKDKISSEPTVSVVSGWKHIIKMSVEWVSTL